MPAMRKLSAEEIKKIESESVCNPVKMTPAMYRKCKEQNSARFTAALENTQERKSR